MRKTIPVIIIFLIFCFMVYNSKTENYERSIEFRKSTFSGEILKITEGKENKIYYENDKYFYESNCEGLEMKVGDVVRKNYNEIIVTRKNSNGEYIEVGRKIIKEPSKSYFNYFFGI
jgi:exopolysaccharide biosynthesis protein